MQSIEHTHHTDIAFYNHDMHNAVRKKNSIESQMYPALQNKEFKLFLQPKFGMKNEGLVERKLWCAGRIQTALTAIPMSLSRGLRKTAFV